ncbi:DNA-(apurinic or apyrimidinic site) lyase [Ranunculus cassubicifolius]
MKMVTYNVNGLRPRIAQHGGSLLKLLNSLDADIICFQETKLSRSEVTADLIMAEGYESFFSCTSTSARGRLAYSGVATFCRVNSAFSTKQVALPLAAEEGFTGLLAKPHISQIAPDTFQGFSTEHLLTIDSEGRCVITDHGHFVLFNIYGPRAASDDTERIDFKLNFFNILQKRWDAYFRQGRRVFVVGDLNIAPSAVDRCEAGPDFEDNQFRKWFRSLLVEHGGPFYDAFRVKHPQRKDAYTCWSVASGAEEFNFGSRIDHILVAGSCFHYDDSVDGHNFVDCHINDCDIMNHFKRWKPENIPRWKGGSNVRLEGSDHAPVYVSLREVPDLPEHNTPSFSARYVPTVRGFQQTIATFLSKRQVNTAVKGLKTSELCDENEKKSLSNETTSQDGFVSDSSSLPNFLDAKEESEHRTLSIVANEADGENAPFISRCEPRKCMPEETKKNNKRARQGSSIQRTLGSYFQTKISSDAYMNSANADSSHSQEDIDKIEDATCVLPRGLNSSEGLHVDDDVKNSSQENDITKIPSIECSPEKEKNNVALREWQRIQQVMLKRRSVPLCKGHGEPCVARVVKKEGSNFGRKFFVCRRSEGPSSNPDARCDYFKWETQFAHQRR